MFVGYTAKHEAKHTEEEQQPRKCSRLASPEVSLSLQHIAIGTRIRSLDLYKQTGQ